MKKIIFTIFITNFYALTLNAQSLHENDVLIIEPSAPSLQQYPFKDGDTDHPSRSDFIIINQVLMSNNNGERWATVTLRNQSNGQRLLNPEQLYAVFANGEKRASKTEKIKFSANEALTNTFYFGMHKFPILYIYTRN